MATLNRERLPIPQTKIRHGVARMGWQQIEARKHLKLAVAPSGAFVLGCYQTHGLHRGLDAATTIVVNFPK